MGWSELSPIRSCPVRAANAARRFVIRPRRNDAPSDRRRMWMVAPLSDAEQAEWLNMLKILCKEARSEQEARTLTFTIFFSIE
jgi:hypothetical protein